MRGIAYASVLQGQDGCCLSTSAIFDLVPEADRQDFTPFGQKAFGGVLSVPTYFE